MMKRNLILIFFGWLVFNTGVYAQYKLHIEVSAPGKIKTDSIYIAGSFNNWNPADPGNALGIINNRYVFEKDVPQGKYEFKFTRGSWEKVETGIGGSTTNNRIVDITSDTFLVYNIIDWKDNFPPVLKPHTASINVHIIDTAFHMSKLNRNRRIWIYLPKDYNTGKKKYPVFYMHDGQNLFDLATSGYGEWGIDEILDSLTDAGHAASIVIGIDNGPRRMNEYNPYEFESAGIGEGDGYIDFIVKDLKPYIDKHFKTLLSKENTIIAGSSMGGLISYYAALKYPSVFGRAGVFSPAFWTAPAILPLTDTLAGNSKGMYFFYMGSLEGNEMNKKMNDVITDLGKSSGALIYTVTDPGGNHNEAAWRKWFPEFYVWVTSNGHTHIIRQ